MEMIMKYKFSILAIVLLLSGFLAGCFAGKISDNKSNMTVETGVVAVADKSKVDVKESDKVQDFGKPALIYFYSPDCSSCSKFKSNWLYLKKHFGKKFEFLEVNVDDSRLAPLSFEFMVTTIPTVFLEDAKFRHRAYINPVEYHFLPRFEDELNRYLELREVMKRGYSIDKNLS